MVVLLAVGAWAAFHFFASSSNDNGNTTKHSAAPTITLNIPSSNLELAKSQGFFEVSANISGGSLISRVEFLIDDKVAATSIEAPYRVTIDISDLTVGEHTLKAVAYNASGKLAESDVFTFIIKAGDEVVPADDESQATVDNSGSIGAQVRTTTRTASKSTSGGNSNSGGGSGNNNGNNGNGGDGGDGGNTAWPATPPAQICGSSMLNNGPTSAPSGAITVPAGDNSTVNFSIDGATYWFATGVHYLGNQPNDQIIPGDNSTFIGAPGAVISGQGVNENAFTQHATGVTIQYLTIQNFNTVRDQGTVNHDSGVGWTFEYNTLQNNEGGALFLGTDNVAKYNCLKDNGQYGFQVYSSDPGGPTNVLLDHNEIVGNNTHNWESIINGCGCTGGGKFWEAHNVTVTNNYVHGNLSVGLWADTNDTDFLIDGNYISDNKSQGLFYEISYNMIVRNNNFIRNGIVDGVGNAGFPTGAIYLSEAGGDSRVAGRTHQIEIYNNNFDDNWAGVILWENADRFCNSPANTSSGTCTMVNPNANLTTCNDPALGGSINVEPYKSDCRWKTQNVTVHNNTFKTTPANISGCTTSSSCGYQGIFSNFGTFPSWSPYMGAGIQHAITYDQNNHFSNNTYLGDWRFKAETQDSEYNFALWQDSPYFQDVGSTYNGQDHLAIANALDADTATLEGGIGEWVSWFNTTLTRTTAEAHTGTHSLKVDITGTPWGLQVNNSDGFPITSRDKNISFWAKAGTGGSIVARMDVYWLDANHNTLAAPNDVTSLSSPTLTSSWQQTSIPIKSVPTGARYVVVKFVNNSGATGNSFYIDDIVVGDN